MVALSAGHDAVVQMIDTSVVRVHQQGAWANTPPKRNRKAPICFSPYLYRARNLVERFFDTIKQCRRVATQCDQLASTIWQQSELGCVTISPRSSFRDAQAVKARVGQHSVRGCHPALISRSRQLACSAAG